ncbi:MAG: CRTAC1 family protein [Acidobacteriota bacterium]
MRRPRPHLRLALALGAALLGLALAGPAIAEGPEPPFVDQAAEAGLDFVHWNGMIGDLQFPEMTGQGAALADLDGDGDLDVYLVQGTWIDDKREGAVFPPPSKSPMDRLFRNDGTKGDGPPRFTDVTAASGLRATGYGMGVVAGDVDGDGRVDLFVANFGSDQLWRNLGPGKDGTPRFEEVGADAGVDGSADAWSIGGSFFDYDRDGLLDLFVIDYVEYDEKKNIVCYATSSRRDYCGPSAFPPTSNRLYRNLGPGEDGRPRFEDVTAKVGITAPGASLGVVAADLDDDGWLDLYVANDGQANHLWLSRRGDGGWIHFQDEALLAGVAVNRQGRPEASMGVAAGDADGDGDLDLFMTHLMGETNTFYSNLGGGLFEDRTVEAGLAASSLGLTSFGTGFLDVENDGDLDLVAVSGAVRILEELAESGDPLPLAQPDQLFMNQGGRFEDASAEAGPGFTTPGVGRGAAFGDVDDDGDIDVLVTQNAGPVRLLRNTRGQDTPWVGLRLLTGDEGRRRDAFGARVELRRKGAPALVRWVTADGSYASANDPRVLFGLGAAQDLTDVRVRWLDGTEEAFPAPTHRSYTTLTQGGGSSPDTEGPGGESPPKTDPNPTP